MKRYWNRTGNSYGRCAEAVFALQSWQTAEAHLFTSAVTKRTEDALLLYGHPVINPAGALATWVLTAVPAICKTTAVTVEVQPESFAQARLFLEKEDHSDQVLVGWWHSQPGLGVRPSGQDDNTHKTHFCEPHMLMVISDPNSQKVAVYAWQDSTRYRRLARYAKFAGNAADYLGHAVPLRRPDRAPSWDTHVSQQRRQP